ncbi:MAG: hypothetical protein IJZ74_08215 [Clostridia bacterium]|nr:hypothetical protein [Clostridia bacterium]
MSNEVQRAIDTGLSGLQVTECDVNRIMQRVRTEAEPEGKRNPAMRRVRFSVALAMAMAVLIVGVALTVMNIGMLSRQPREVHPLSGQNGSSGNGDMVNGTDEITAEEAIRIAERYIHTQEDASVNLRDAAVYQIGCQYCPADAEHAGNCYRVLFKALTAYATEYTVEVAADGTAFPQVLSMKRQRGAGEWHTAEEMRIGFSRVYGTDMTRWTWQQLRTYCRMLISADHDTMRWADVLMREMDYYDPESAAMTREGAEQHALAQLKTQGITGEVEAAIYMRSGTDYVWKVTVRQTSPSQDGLEWVHLLEISCQNGAIVDHSRVDRVNVGMLPFIASGTNQQWLQYQYGSSSPALTDAEVMRIAEEHIREKYGETRSISDPALFTCRDCHGYIPYQLERYLVYQPVNAADVTYWVCIDWYGSVMDSGAGCVKEGITDLDLIRMYATDSAPYQPREKEPEFYGANNQPMSRGYNTPELLSIQEMARDCGDPEDPVVQVLLNTTYGNLSYNSAYHLADVTLALKNRGHNSILIERDGVLIEKFAIQSDKGCFLVEINLDTKQMISVVQVEDCYDPWYAPFLLQEDMEKAGIAPKACDTVPMNNGTVYTAEEAGVVSGMRISHLNERYQQLYSLDIADWSQEQLRAWQQLAIVTESPGDDMGIYCLRRTYYPDVPANAITRERAAAFGASALGLAPGYLMDGAVLIGTDDTPVWKVCLYGTKADASDSAESYWYAEVNCLTGEVTAVRQRIEGATCEMPYYGNNPVEYWFRDIVLEKTIQECEEDWNRTSNG